MSPLSWFDNRTLFGCQCMLVVMFAFVFLWVHRAYPSIRGIRSTVFGYLVGVPCTLLMVARGHIPGFLSISVGNLLAMISLLCLYDGTARFIGGRRWLRELIILSGAGLAVVVYYSEIRSDIVPRIVAMALVFAAFRLPLAWELIRLSSGSANRGTMRFLGAFLAVLGLFNLYRAGMTLAYGAPENFMERNAVQTTTLVTTVLYIGVSGLCFLVMAAHELIAKSVEASERDPLSGVLNRRGIEGRLKQELERSERGRQRLSLALVDIDHFKKINDTQGHAAGDAAIREVASAMARQLRTSDALGRYGGDEFLVVLPMTMASEAVVVAERLNEAVNGLESQGLNLGLTLSLGITEASPDDDAISLLARADEALYQAKSAGRNCMRTALPERTFGDVVVSEVPSGRLGLRMAK